MAEQELTQRKKGASSIDQIKELAGEVQDDVKKHIATTKVSGRGPRLFWRFPGFLFFFGP